MAKPTLDDLFAELQQGRVYECALRDEDWHLDGLTDMGTGAVYIDPRPAILDTLLHELLHRHKPWWSETAVRRHTATLMKSLREDDLRRWWRAYKRIKRAHRPVDTHG